MRLTWIALTLTAIAALLMATPALNNDRARKLEVYRAFAVSYGENHAINLANVTTRFDAPNEAVMRCAPSVLLTTALTRNFRSQTFAQGDFSGVPVRVVDPNVQRLIVHTRDPYRNITGEGDIDEALQSAFDAGLLQVSDVGFNVTGQRAVLTFSFSCGELCGHSGTAMLQRQRGQWVRSQQTCGNDAFN